MCMHIHTEYCRTSGFTQSKDEAEPVVIVHKPLKLLFNIVLFVKVPCNSFEFYYFALNLLDKCFMVIFKTIVQFFFF